MATPDFPKMTPELLRSFSEAALGNAHELATEASLLLEHDHVARAYFLAVASVEETGKALLAFDGQNRNLADPAVCTKLKAAMEAHAEKLNYAIGTWAMNSSDPRKVLMEAVNLVVDLQLGREPSMYTELRADPDRAQMPRQVIRPSAATDCVRLARDSLAYARRHVREKAPAEFTSAQDRLFTMKRAKFLQMLKNEDFWWYYIARMEAGQQDVADAILGYEQEHLKPGTPFRTT